MLIFNSLLCSLIETNSSFALRLNVETKPSQCISISFEFDGITLILPSSPSTTICSTEPADRRTSSPTSFLPETIFPINKIPMTPIAISKIATALKTLPLSPNEHDTNLYLLKSKLNYIYCSQEVTLNIKEKAYTYNTILKNKITNSIKNSKFNEVNSLFNFHDYCRYVGGGVSCSSFFTSLKISCCPVWSLVCSVSV